MSKDEPKTLTDAVQYMQQYKTQYSLEELKQKLQSSGYPENIVSEAEKRVFVTSSKDSVNVGSSIPVTKKVPTYIKIVEFIVGFVGYYILVIVGFGIIGLGISIYIYFRFRKSRRYIALGVLWAFIASVSLIIVMIALSMIAQSSMSYLS